MGKVKKLGRGRKVKRSHCSAKKASPTSVLLGCLGALAKLSWGIAQFTVGIAAFISPALAQSNIVPDNTLGFEASGVIFNFNGTPNEVIDGGAQRGQNLFHSFREFNVGENRGAYFQVFDPNIQNILARVTGSNRSEILGTLGTIQIIDSNFFRTNANLFLMNPNGIVFGENARLDVDASFVATTANGIQFGNQGSFSATNPQTPGVLTINPSALFFNQINQIGTIENRGLLRVPNGASLLLVGGEVRLDGGILAAFGGRVELGGLADAGSVGVDFASQGLKLQFPELGQKADVSLVNTSIIDVSANGGGDIAINARNLNILTDSHIFAGIDGGFGSVNTQAGDITINASDTVRIESDSSIRSDVSPDETGNGGNINIKSTSLFVLGGSSLISRTSGIGNAGNININALDRIVFSGDDTTVDSGVRLTGRGKGGNISISTNTLEMLDGAQLITPVLGVGDGGNIVIEASDRVSLTGNKATNFSNTAIFSSLGGNDNSQAEGKGGDIRISTNILELSNDAQMSSSTFGIGDAGNIIIEARDRATFKGDDTVVASRVERTGRGKGGDIRISTNILELFDDATFNASTLNFGDAGNILIEAGDRAFFDNAYIFNSVWGAAMGKGGDISINTGNLFLTNGAALSTITYGKGDSGNITIEAKDNVSLNKGGSLLSQVSENALGKGGNINIYTNSLLLNAVRLNASTSGTGDAGNITIDARDTVSADTAIISSNVEKTGIGKGGDINISSASFSLVDYAIFFASTLGNGNAGDVLINAREATSIDTGYIFTSVETGAFGEGGDIKISTDRLSLTNGGTLASRTDGTGKAGNIILEAKNNVLLDGINPNDKNFITAISTSVEENGIGQGGKIHIATGTFSLTNGAQLIAVTGGQGDAGNVQISTSDAVNIAGSTAASGRSSAILTFTESDNSGGNITVDTSAFRISEGAVLDSRTTAAGRGGNITINTNSLEAISGGQLQASTDGSGQAGEITINANANITISGSDPIFSERAALIPEINWRYNPNSGFYNRSIGSGIAGDIEVNSASLSVFNGGQIQASTFGEGKAGNVWINSRDRITMDGVSVNENGLSPSGIFSEIFNPQVLGKGGNITIETDSLKLTNGAQLRASTWGVGDAGDITINAKNGVSIAGTSQNGNLLSGVLSTVQLAGQGNGGDINIQAGSLSVTGGAQLQTGTRNRGDAGNIFINTRDFVLFDGTSSTGQIPSSAFSSVEQGAVGKGGNIEINTGHLFVDNRAQLITSNNGGKGNGGNIRVDAALLSLTGNSQLRASTQGEGDAGNIFISTRDRTSLDDGAIISNIVGTVSSPGRFGNGKGGLIRIDTGSLSVANGSQLQASTFGTGDAGDIIINAHENISFDGFISLQNSILNSAAFSIIADNSTGNGGNIRVNTAYLAITNGGLFSTTAFGQGKAGSININVDKTLNLTNGNILTFSRQSSGGSVNVNAENIRFFGDSNISTSVVSGAGGGGDIKLTADSILAFGDSDIFAFAQDGKGGNITFDTPAFFGQNYRPATPGTNPLTLEENNRVDINASGAVSGVIVLPDTSFVQNNLGKLPQTAIDTNALIANSCIARRNQQQNGSFFITGSGGVPVRPGDAPLPSYSTGDVQPIPAESTTLPTQTRPWQIGDRIIEPTGVYELPNGKLVLGKEC
ncbi:filamentous hemagglutinin N-terminal domain-containing protein [Tolypothrix sp. PCC 7601]|uniref:two-partner secretion domain-containing protein n=1 Tax=Tolypothrix sp. PCC 7712 TaxID=2596898 RepID=UPI0021F6BBA1|nr:filamentous hemagglutinin N-terminal domain-containing protein [Tolypothrix sp. PCC 7712]UYD34460.1 filamentous hemagglutinin N-terminal domain-containing protein [Tolypothrix sp. PCC 7601]